ncbi:hypothetical protein MYX06_04055 [Patescibacteria group bacterium AH-259-L05]|nr:hypothetical protein [Patescibacteria group bacterium AH-259-L05]
MEKLKKPSTLNKELGFDFKKTWHQLVNSLKIDTFLLITYSKNSYLNSFNSQY